jgi:hypothetical protein
MPSLAHLDRYTPSLYSFHVGDGALVVINPKKDLAIATSYLETLKTVENLTEQ